MATFKKKEIAALHKYVEEGRTQHMGTMSPVKVYWDFLRDMILKNGVSDVDKWDDLSCEEEFSLYVSGQEDWPTNARYVASNVLKMYANEKEQKSRLTDRQNQSEGSALISIQFETDPLPKE